MTNEEAKKMLKAKLECFKNEISGINHDCNMRLCDGCSLNYEQGNMGEQKEALDMAIKALEQTRWIPVSEKLPTTDDDVLVTTGKEIYVGWINLADKAWRVDSENEYLMDNIIAWMPLPQPYKVESEEV